MGVFKKDSRAESVQGLDRQIILREAEKLIDPSRRLFAKQALSLGALSLMTGCALTDNASVERALKAISRFNDRVQAWLFDPDKLAPEYPETMMTRPFPFNAFYRIDKVPHVSPQGYALKLSGLVDNKKSVTLVELGMMEQRSQVTRHICVEGWSAIGKWGGVRFSEFLTRVGADMTARYVGFHCADGYYQSIDMPTALHAQTILALTYDGETLPDKYGYPIKLRMPTKLGYKNPKHITEIFVTNDYPGGYWEDQGYNWFGGS